MFARNDGFEPDVPNEGIDAYQCKARPRGATATRIRITGVRCVPEVRLPRQTGLAVFPASLAIVHMVKCAYDARLGETQYCSPTGCGTSLRVRPAQATVRATGFTVSVAAACAW